MLRFGSVAWSNLRTDEGGRFCYFAPVWDSDLSHPRQRPRLSDRCPPEGWSSVGGGRGGLAAPLSRLGAESQRGRRSERTTPLLTRRPARMQSASGEGAGVGRCRALRRGSGMLPSGPPQCRKDLIVRGALCAQGCSRIGPYSQSNAMCPDRARGTFDAVAIRSALARIAGYVPRPATPRDASTPSSRHRSMR